MRRLWLWDNGDTTLQEYPPMGKGQWIENCKFCGKIPKIREDKRIFCTNTDCVNNKSYSLTDWNNRKPKMTLTDAQTGQIFISLEERVKRLEERLDKMKLI